MNMKIGWFCGPAAVVGLAAALAVPAFAAKPVAIEKELLGVRVLQSYREVLLRYGAPTRIFRATETVNYLGAVNLAGQPTGGIIGLLDSSSSGGAGGPGGPMMGGPGGPMMGGPPGMRGAGKGMGGGLQGLPGGGSSPAFGGGSPSGYPGMGGPSGGAGGQAGDNPDATYSGSGGFIWVYLYPFKQMAYEFHFNKDGRIESIAEFGRGPGQHTSRGVGLGDTVEKVYSVYGWTDQIKEEEPGKFSLLYNDRYHAQFIVLKNKVIGISVFLRENQFTRLTSGGAVAGGQGMPGMSGGMPGMRGGQQGGGQGRMRPRAGGGGGGLSGGGV
jgi:hypothetical protein